ncbi:SDR family oxidoreductase [Streptomyces sp. NPDC055186]
MGLDLDRTFAASGAAVAPTDIDEAALTSEAEQLTGEGHHVIAIICDVADEDQVAAAVDHTVDICGRLDMTYDNAGIQIPPADAAGESAEVFDCVPPSTCGASGPV